MKILISPNGYKECADPVEAASLFYEFLSGKGFDLVNAPVSDGGDGFLAVCRNRFKLKEYFFEAETPDGTIVRVPAGYDPGNEYLYIESAEVIGLKKVPADKRNPMELTTRGLGQLIKSSLGALKIKKIIIGIGGTAVNDLGLGMLSELGLTLLDAESRKILPQPRFFQQVRRAEWNPVIETKIEIIADVGNPLTGRNGSTFIYGPQKGLKEKDLESLDNEISRLTRIFLNLRSFDPDALSGAGGGLAAGLQMFFNPDIKSSGKFLLEDLNISELISGSDLIITGEGHFDGQSYWGKATGTIIRNTSKPVFLVCGSIDEEVKIPPNISPISLEDFFRSREESILNFREGIKKAAGLIERFNDLKIHD